MKIIIDPGHGGKADGAKGLSMLEKDINLYAGLMLAGYLRAYGYDIVLTRKRDKTVSLDRRVEIANTENADLFISLHCNGNENPKYNGMECYTSIGETESDIWAGLLQTALLARFPDHKDFAGHGTSEENFRVLKKTHMAAVLIEMEFITNPANEVFLKTRYPEIVEVIAETIDKMVKNENT